MKKLRVAVLGHGHLGKWHCEKVGQAGPSELLYIVETRTSEHALIAQKYPQVKIVEYVEALRGQVDAAIVATPTFTHFSLVKELLTLGLHVFCEKPLCQSTAEAAQLEKLAESKKLLLQVGHSERFHQCFEDLSSYKDFLRAPAILHLERAAPYKGRATDVDVIADLMIHDVDLMLKLLAEPPRAVRALGKKILSDHYDYVWAQFFFASGSEVSILASRVATHEKRTVEVTGAVGTLYFDLFAGLIEEGRWQQGKFELSQRTYPKRDHLLLEHQAFYRSILEHRPVVVSAQEAKVVISLLEKISEALSSQREVSCQ